VFETVATACRVLAAEGLVEGILGHVSARTGDDELLTLRPVFGAFDIPGLRLALRGVPRYERSVLITRAELAAEMLAAMGESTTCLLVGHGITVAGDTVEQATVRAVVLERLCWVSLRLAQLGASPPAVPDADLAELPDLGGRFNDELTWRALVAAEHS
jgi:ribulose-5-phosphate 4-epimerase/fuculose-1-phosphate aldolase